MEHRRRRLQGARPLLLAFAFALPLAAGADVAEEEAEAQTGSPPATETEVPATETEVPPTEAEVPATEAEAGERPLDQTAAPELGNVAEADRRVFTEGVARATPEQLIGREAVNLEGETLGRVDEIVRDIRADSLHAVIATGGFWGIGERQALVPLRQLELLDDDRVRIESTVSPEQFQQLATFDRHGYEPVEREHSIASIAGLQEGEVLTEGPVVDDEG